MKYLHSHEDFKYFIIETARQVNLSEFIVEKDYWVTYLLKNPVKSEFANEFVFKGGTCLSKAYNLIERFSEDIDLLMLETEKTQSKTQKEKRLVALREYIDGLEDLTYTTGNRSALYAAFRFSFPTISTNITDSVGKEILLEPGFRGGTAPEIEKKTITSYVEKLLDGKLFVLLSQSLTLPSFIRVSDFVLTLRKIRFSRNFLGQIRRRKNFIL
ncbi:MAG: nucleotidyl transferase AbiEii/AbiGii toxin family protein [Candidatus Gastranaerophilales bacterium]|nr:nucleotidyl transferase AbiEii/AbiGii toxin family protein [Candidatus Gastranaerophilales bacterium]